MIDLGPLLGFEVLDFSLGWMILPDWQVSIYASSSRFCSRRSASFSCTFPRGDLVPMPETAVGRLNCRIDIGRIRVGDVSNDLAGSGIDLVQRLAGVALNVAAIDKQCMASTKEGFNLGSSAISLKGFPYCEQEKRSRLIQGRRVHLTVPAVCPLCGCQEE